MKRKRIWQGSGDYAQEWEVEELEIKPLDPITATRELNKLQGNHAPERHEHSGPWGSWGRTFGMEARCVYGKNTAFARNLRMGNTHW